MGVDPPPVADLAHLGRTGLAVVLEAVLAGLVFAEVLGKFDEFALATPDGVLWQALGSLGSVVGICAGEDADFVPLWEDFAVEAAGGLGSIIGTISRAFMAPLAGINCAGSLNAKLLESLLLAAPNTFLGEWLHIRPPFVVV
jgi:hypothetical protein